MSEATPTLSETMLVSERDHLPWCDISRVVVTRKLYVCQDRAGVPALNIVQDGALREGAKS